MDTARWTIVGAVSVSLLAVGLFWYTLPDGGEMVARAPVKRVEAPAGAPQASKPSPRPSQPRAAGANGRQKAKAQRAKAQRAKAQQANTQRAAKGPRASKAKLPRDGAEIPADVLETLDEIRAEKVAKSEAKLELYAEKANWDENTTQSVNQLVANAHADVDTLIANATAGDVPWTQVRGEVRQIRLEQARAVREELGPDEFGRFAKAMGRAGRGRGKR